MQAKISVMLPAANPAAARVLADLGADTINLPTDLSLAQIAAIRAAVDIPLDVYVEAPDNVGGFVRHHEIPELIRVAAPVYVKFGLRNAPDVYPSGTHLDSTTIALSRERVRRARLGMELLARSGYEPTTSELGAAGLAVPVPVIVRLDVEPGDVGLGLLGGLSNVAISASATTFSGRPASCVARRRRSNASCSVRPSFAISRPFARSIDFRAASASDSDSASSRSAASSSWRARAASIAGSRSVSRNGLTR